MTDKNVLLVEEQALHEQEQGLVAMEAQLHTQEQGQAQMERAFLKKSKALLNHASYVKEQETSLLRRAEAMGPRSSQLAAQLLAQGDGHVSLFDADLGRLADRQTILQRRKDLMSARMALMEEREALYSARAEALERAESQVGDLEGRLVRRESTVSDAARQVFSAASNMLDDDDDEGEPAPALSYASAGVGGGQVGVARVRQHTPAMEMTASAAVRALEPHALSSRNTVPLGPRAESIIIEEALPGGHGRVGATGPTIGGEPVHVASGEVDHGEDEDDSIGGVSRAEDKATRKRASARARVRTNQFKITLEAHLDHGEPHHFFRYENDGPADLPGLFIATPNLLKVGREVRIRVGRTGQFLEATGIVAWRRQRGDSGGTPGMGIELLNLSEPERNLVGKWINDKAPVTI